MLPGDYVAGLVDGEGCFSLSYRRVFTPKKSLHAYFYWTPRFAIVMHRKDRRILEQVQETLGCGAIHERGSTAHLYVARVTDLAGRIVPFFTQFRLRAAKAAEFALWARAVELIARNLAPVGSTAELGRRGFRRKSWPEGHLAEIEALHHRLSELKGSSSRHRWHPRQRSSPSPH